MTDLTKHLPQQSKTVTAIFDYYKKTGDAEPARGYLGASIIGHECERYLWYYFRHCCQSSFDGRMYRLFATGDLAEYRFVADLQAIGCTVHATDSDGKQFAVEALGGHFSGHMDGCVLGVPEAPKTWHVGEFKTHNAKSFAKLKKEGVMASKPQHYAQMMVYMHLTGMTRALYLAVNKDTDDLYTERIRYDKTEAEQLIERARRVITSTTPPERIASRRDFYRCSYCDAQDICWGTTAPEPALPVPSISCRQCCHATADIEGQYGRWVCEKHKRALSGADQGRACDDHLILPGLLSFAEPTDYSRDEQGNDTIEFTDTEGREFRHGKAMGCYSTRELTTLPAEVLVNEMLSQAKDLFGATAEGYEIDILARYPAEDSRKVWSGGSGKLVSAWAAEFGEDLMQLTPVARCDLPEYAAAEYKGGRVAIYWKKPIHAEIRKGVE